MKCKSFGKCGSCTLYDISYQKQIDKKSSYIKNEFCQFYDKEIDFYESSSTHFRNRAEFRIWHDKEQISYAMNGFNKKDIVKINSCQIVEKKIQDMMGDILEYIQSNQILKNRLFTIEYISGEELLVTLIYHRKIDKIWEEEAGKLEKKFSIFIIGRSRGVRKVLTKDFVYQNLSVLGKRYRYKVYENSFLQPNTKVNEKMISWAKKYSKDFGGDMLELYCGHGNFTIPLSENFKKVLATEISKKSIKSAKENCIINDIDNIFFARLSAEEFTSALNKEREFKRLKDVNLDSYDFSTIFIDPPRAGVDKKSLSLVSVFDNIIYISCNPETLKRDLQELCKTHRVVRFAVFDQFAYTNHLECGVVLRKTL